MTLPRNYSDLRKQPRLNLAEAVPLPMPLSMYIDPCCICNFQCIFCPQSKVPSRELFSTRMDLADFQKVVADITALGRLKTCNLFSFGEPLLNPLTPEFLRLATSAGIAEKYVMTTNASLLDEAKARALVDYGLNFLRVSIYGTDTASYQRRTGRRVELSRILENLRFLKEYRDATAGQLSIAVKMLDSGNAEENARFLEQFADVGDECFLEPLHNWHDKDMHFISASPDSRTVCPYPFYTLVVHADLTVSVCCPDWNKQLTIGSLRTEHLAALWNGKKLHDLRLALLRQDFSRYAICRDCDFYKLNAGDNLDSFSAEEFLQRTSGGQDVF